MTELEAMENESNALRNLNAVHEKYHHDLKRSGRADPGVLKKAADEYIQAVNDLILLRENEG